MQISWWSQTVPLVHLWTLRSVPQRERIRLHSPLRIPLLRYGIVVVLIYKIGSIDCRFLRNLGRVAVCCRSTISSCAKPTILRVLSAWAVRMQRQNPDIENQA